MDGTPLANATLVPSGTTIRYTVQVSNDQNLDASGAQLSDRVTTLNNNAAAASQMAVRFVSCSVNDSNLAQCPADSDFRAYDRTSQLNNPVFGARIPKFLAGGRLTVVYDVTYIGSTMCGLPAGLADNYATMAPPPAQSAGYYAKTVGPASVTLGKTVDCPELAITKTQSTNKPQMGVPYLYKVVVSNKGPGNADGALWHDYMRGMGSADGLNVKVRYVSCVPSPGAQCPPDAVFASPDPLPLDTVTSSSAYRSDLMPKNTPIPKLPAGSQVELTYEITPYALDATACKATTGTILNDTSVRPANGAANTTKRANVELVFDCADIGISKTVDPVFVKAGQQVVYQVVVSNSGLSAASNVVFSDPLPEFFVFEKAKCELRKQSGPALPHPRTECGASVDYDAANHRLTSTIKSLGQLGEVLFTIEGHAGVVPGTYKNVAEAIVPAGLFDPNLKSNVTDVNIQIQNTQSQITVEKQLAGVPSSGLPVDMTFSGTVACSTQPAQPWSITVPAGQTKASSAPFSYFDGELCSVTEDPPPAAPYGYDWVGTPVIANPSTPLGPATAVTIPVTNTLQRQLASLDLTKLIAGPAAGLGLVNGQFDFVLNCGADGSFTASIVVVGGVSNKVTVGGLPVGASCSLSEPGRAAAPPGYEWEAPVIAPSSVVIPAQGMVGSATVTNPLKRLLSALSISKAIDGAADGVAKVNASFAFQLDCGADGKFNTQVSVVGGASASSVVSDVPAGASCQLSETSVGNPPDGYRWEPPVFDQNPVLVPASGAAVSAKVTNPLKRGVGSLSLTKQFSGPADVVQKVNGRFAFALNCGADGNFTTEVVVANGAAASATVQDLPAGASCQIAETATATAPDGYRWGTPVFDKNPVLVSTSGTVVSVQATNPLQRGQGSLSLTKQFSGPADAVQKVNGRFAFALNCGADGNFTTEVVVTNGAAATVVLDNLPEGASCQVSETASAAAPAGFTWAAPVFESNPVKVSADGSVSRFKMTNQLSAGNEPTPVPAMNLAMLLGLALAVAACGANWVRRQRRG